MNSSHLVITRKPGFHERAVYMLIVFSVVLVVLLNDLLLVYHE